MIEKEQFVTNLMQESETVQDPELAEHFSGLWEKKRSLFSNIYEQTFIRKVSQLEQDTLIPLIKIFSLSDEYKDYKRYVSQMEKYIPNIDILIANLNNLRLTQWSSLLFDDEPSISPDKWHEVGSENILSSATRKILQSCQWTFFDVLSTHEWELEFLKKKFLFLSKKKLPLRYFTFVESVFQKCKIIDRDFRSNKIIVNVSNKMDRFVLWSIRNQIAPFQIINNLDQNKETLTKNLNQDIESFAKTKGIRDVMFVEVFDINYESQEILLNNSGFFKEDIILELQSFLKEHLKPQVSQTDTSLEENSDTELSLEDTLKQSLILAE